MSLLSLCFSAPQELYPFNDAIMVMMGEHNRYVKPRVIARLRLCNMLMWKCEKMPPCMAVLVFFWLADLHEGVRIMIKQAEGASSPFSPLLPHLFGFVHALITDITNRNITELSTPRRAAQFYCALAYTLNLNRVDIMTQTPLLLREKVPKPAKKIFLTQWKAKQQRKGNAASQALDEEAVKSDDEPDENE